MQDKHIDTGNQLIEDLFSDMVEETDEMTAAVPAQPVIRIVHFDDSDRPVASEARPLHSFL